MSGYVGDEEERLIPSSKRRRSKPRRGRKKRIGNADTTAFNFHEVGDTGGECSWICSAKGGNIIGIGLVSFALAAVIIALIVVSVTYAGRGSPSGGVTTTATTTTTTASTTPTTTESTGATTTAPVDMGDVVITCPDNITIPLGKPFDEEAAGSPIVSGGCTPPDTSFMDDIVAGGGAKRNIAPTLPLPQGARALPYIHNIPRVIHGTRFTMVRKRGSPHHPTGGGGGKKSSAGMGSRTLYARAPNFPNSQIVPTHTAIIMDSGSVPPNPALDVSTTQVVACHDTPGGAIVTIYSKTLGTPLSSFTMSSLPASMGSVCETGGGDSDILFDHFSSRWIFLERASIGNTICLYATDGPDILTSTIALYEITLAFVPDYPKLGLLNDFYTLTFNSGTTPVQMAVIERSPIVSASATTRGMAIPSPLPNLAGFDFQSFSPAVADAGLQPNASLPGILFLRHRDDEFHSPGTAVSGSDFIDIVHCTTIDFDAVSVTCVDYTIAISEFNSADTACASSDACVETPGSVVLNPIRQVLMHRVVFRNIPECNDAHRLYASFVTDANGVGNSKVRWVELELNATSVQFQLRQEGLINPDLESRWVPSVTADIYGNTVMIYSVSGGSTSPSLRISSRMQDDALGTMRDELAWATGNTWADPVGPDANLWGGSFATAVDPSQPYTYFGIGQYAGTVGTWLLRVTRFSMQGNTIHRTWYTEDTCFSNATCIQEIILGDGGA